MTEEIIEKHLKIMDKIDKKKKDVKDIIMKGEKLADMAKAPVRRVDRMGVTSCAGLSGREAE